MFREGDVKEEETDGSYNSVYRYRLLPLSTASGSYDALNTFWLRIELKQSQRAQAQPAPVVDTSVRITKKRPSISKFGGFIVAYETPTVATLYVARIEGLTEGLATEIDIMHRGEMSFGRKRWREAADSHTSREGPTRSWSYSLGGKTNN